MNVLQQICAHKREHVAARRALLPLALLKEKVLAAQKPRGFVRALRAAKAPAIIAEIKKASPSRGVIRAGFDPAAIARIYAQHGATCLSVLTDTPYFQGQDEDLVAARTAMALPVLRKDFMLDEYQIYESRALGADCVLLIIAALQDDEAAMLHNVAQKLGMDVLVEVHDEEDLNRALPLAPAMIGVNNRSLKTLAVDVNTSLRLAPALPAGSLWIAESGLADAATLQRLGAAGYGGFLIGESLMREADIGVALSRMLTLDGN